MCESTARMGTDMMCRAICAALPNIYFSDSQCVSTCPNGTYLTFTNIECESCAAICRTCTSSASNCLSCASSYMYNSTCQAKCPTGFYGNAELICESCEGLTIPACEKPLTFTTSTGQENFKYFVVMEFSEPLDLSDPTVLDSLFTVNVNPGRRLQTTIATLVRDGIKY